MVRIKRGVAAHKRRKHLLEYAKGFRLGRKSKYRLAKEAIYHAFKYATRDRKAKKRDFRQLWQLQINAASRNSGTNYNKLISGLKAKKVTLNRKMLSLLAKEKPEIFAKIAEFSK
jgi:large subunit ribosomal protein L20